MKIHLDVAMRKADRGKKPRVMKLTDYMGNISMKKATKKTRSQHLLQ